MSAGLWKLFEQPPKEFSPVPMWWWSGERLNVERLKWQLDRLVEGGVHQVCVINLAPTGPNSSTRPDDPPWFSPAWWTIFRAVCAHAATLGVRIWFYDQLGFSGANLQGRLLAARPELRGETVACVRAKAGGPTKLSTPSAGKALGAFLLRAIGSGRLSAPIRLPLTSSTLDWTGSEDGELLLAYSTPRGYDYLSAAGGAALIDAVHGEFERQLPEFMGSTIVGSFQDELPRMPLWSPGFLRSFSEQHGYDLVPLLPALWLDWGEQAQRVRCDYQATRTHLAEECFFKPLFQWHEARGLQVGCDQQSPARSGNPLEGSQLYGDYLATHRWFSAPGSDHWGDVKVHSSLAHLYGRPYVWFESFHSTGWGGTLEETFDWLLPALRAGATLYDPHAVYYSTAGGWFEWAPPSTCWRQPYWRHYPIFATAVSRLCAVLAQGVHRCDVGVLFPTSTVHAHVPIDLPVTQLSEARAKGSAGLADRAQDVFLQVLGVMKWLDVKIGVLDRDRRDFDVIDEPSLKAAAVRDGRMCIGAESYRALVLPALTHLPAAAADALRAFANCGGVLVSIGDPPAALAGVAGVRVIASADQLPAALADVPRVIDAPVPTLLREIDGHPVLFVPAAYPTATRQPIAPGQMLAFSYDFDAQRYAKRMTVTAHGLTGEPVAWDPVTGQRRKLTSRTREDGALQIEVDFPSLPAALVVFESADSAASAVPVECGEPALQTQVLDGSWKVEPLPTLDNAWGDFDRPARSGPPDLRIWTMLHRADPHGRGLVEQWQRASTPRDEWSEIRPTFAARALVFGRALPMDELPAALAPEDLRAVRSGSQSLGGEGWNEASYSSRRGIDRDVAMITSLGSKGYVPEEFLALPLPQPGQGVQFRTLIETSAGTCTLALGASATKQVWWNGVRVETLSHGFVDLVCVTAVAGFNLLEVRLFESQAMVHPLAARLASLRAWWCLVDSPERAMRPEWMLPDDSPARGSLVRHSTTLKLGAKPTNAELVIGGCSRAGRAAVRINGALAAATAEGRTYEDMLASFPTYTHETVTHRLHEGDNDVVIEVVDDGEHRAVFLDLLVEDAAQQRFLTSGNAWETTRDGVAVRTRVNSRQVMPRAAAVRPRLHPLTEARWLDETSDVGSIAAIATVSATTAPAWFRFQIPPGTTCVSLPADGVVSCWVDGVSQSVSDEQLRLAPGGDARTVVVRVEPVAGRSAGGVWRAAPRVEFGAGEMQLRDWQEAGLAGYSGGMSYRRTLTVDGTLSADVDSAVELDLGAVRGTAEVWVNGQLVGARVFSPWRFDLGAHLRRGENELEVRIFNTLAPYFSQHSSSWFALANQLRSGLMGPVVVLKRKASSLAPTGDRAGTLRQP